MEDIFQDIGLNMRESLCYKALLEIGSSKIGQICKKTEIPSSKIYEILNRLINKGLVSYVIKGKVKYYQASSPKNLIHYINEKKRKVEQIIPELLLKQKFSKKQSVEMFEGEKAIFYLFTDLVDDAKRDELYLVFSLNEANKNEKINLFFRNLTLRRNEKKLDVRLLKNIKDYHKEKHTKLKLKYTSFNLPQGITIFRNYLILLSWSELPLAIKIESEVFARQMRDFFLELWKEAK